MSRRNLTSDKRSFGKNPDSFPVDSENEPIVLTIDNDDPLTPATVLVVNPKSLEVSGINGEDVDGLVTVQRRGRYVEKLNTD